MFSSTSFSQQDIVKDGLVLWLDANDKTSYPGSGISWRDLSKSGINGTLTNGPTFNSANGGSIVFDGTNDYSLIPQNLGAFSNNPMTTEMWIYPTDIPAAGRILLMDKPSFPDLYGIETFILNSGGYKIGIRGSGGNLATSNTCLTLNSWQHVVIGFINSLTFIYVNSSIINGTGLTNINPINPSSYNLYLGKYPTLAGYDFAGRISNVRIYNRALSATEVLQNYNATKGRYL